MYHLMHAQKYWMVKKSCQQERCDKNHTHHVQSTLHKTTTLRTTQSWLSWAGGRLIKHLYQMTTDQMWSFLTGFEFFSHGKICLNKDLHLHVFWCHS